MADLLDRAVLRSVRRILDRHPPQVDPVLQRGQACPARLAWSLPYAPLFRCLRKRIGLLLVLLKTPFAYLLRTLCTKNTGIPFFAYVLRNYVFFPHSCPPFAARPFYHVLTTLSFFLGLLVERDMHLTKLYDTKHRWCPHPVLHRSAPLPQAAGEQDRRDHREGRGRSWHQEVKPREHGTHNYL